VPVRRLPRLRSLLLLLTLVILILPLAGLWFLRLYESALIRQTESELVSQAAVLAGAFKAERRHILAIDPTIAEAPVPERHFAPGNDGNEPAYRLTRHRGLDLALDPVMPPPPDPVPPPTAPTALSQRAGEMLAPVLGETKPITLAALRVVDRSGVIVATTGDDLGRSIAGRDEIDKALVGQPVSVMRWREKQAPQVQGGINRGSLLRVFVALPVIEGDQIVGAVLLSRTPSTLAQAVRGKLPSLIAMTALLVGIGVVLSLLVSRVITRPLGQLVAHAKKIADGEAAASPAIRHPGTLEVAELFSAVAKMADTLDRRANYIRGFAANVSHEFKTPLAGAKGAIELLSDHAATMSESERVHFLTVVASSVDRLELLVRRLVDFARADMMRPVPSAPVALAPILERLAADYRKRGLDVIVMADGVVIDLAAEAVEIVISNLLENSLRYAGPGARVTIEAVRDDAGATVIVTDNGPGISEGNAERIFEPFFTTKRDRGGTGLGLSTVRAIITSAGGSIALINPSPQGAAFRIRLAERR